MSLGPWLEAIELKEVLRAGWVRKGVASPESVAAHSWGVAWLVMSLCPDGVDRERAMQMALVHDLAEVRVGDLTPHDQVTKDEKHRLESTAMKGLMAQHPRGRELTALFEEYEKGVTPEAKWVRCCDRLDMALQAQRYAKRDGLDLDEFLQSAAKTLQDEPRLVAMLRVLMTPPC